MSITDVRRFDVKTCAEDFAGPGRKVAVENKTTDFSTRRGMKIKVNGGWTLSCIWGFGAYCDGARQMIAPGHMDHLEHPPEDSPNAEVAAWKGDGKMIEIDTLEQLMDFYATHGDLIIGSSLFNHNQPEIKINDDYIE